MTSCILSDNSILDRIGKVTTVSAATMTPLTNSTYGLNYSCSGSCLLQFHLLCNDIILWKNWWYWVHFEPALECIRVSKNNHFTIFSDSFSCLQSLHNMNIGHPILSSILYNNHQAGHIGIYGNNKADMTAKSAHQFKVANSEFLIKF